jgi:hypothetical protein
MTRAFSIAWVVFALAVSTACGQLAVQCSLVNPRVLQYEPIIMTLKVANRTSEPIVLSGSGPDARVSFDVEEGPGSLVEATDVPALASPMRIEPQEAAQARANLLSAYRIVRPGPYTVTARVRWGGKVYISPRVFLDVLPGLEIAKLTAGLPGGKSTRTFSLRTLSRDMAEHMFLRIDDEDLHTCYGVFDLGRIVRLYPPKIVVDGLGHVHVLHQSGPSQYAHTEFTADGRAVRQDLYASQTAAVSMERGDEGDVYVEGGEPLNAEPEELEEPAAPEPPPAEDASKAVAR